MWQCQHSTLDTRIACFGIWISCSPIFGRSSNCSYLSEIPWNPIRLSSAGLLTAYEYDRDILRLLWSLPLSTDIIPEVLPRSPIASLHKMLFCDILAQTLHDTCNSISYVLIVLGDFSPQGNFRYCGIFTAPTNLFRFAWKSLHSSAFNLASLPHIFSTCGLQLGQI